MRLAKLSLFVFFGLYLSGCAASQPLVSLPEFFQPREFHQGKEFFHSGEFFQSPDARVGVVTRKPEAPAFIPEGNYSLLDRVVIAASNVSLNEHVKTLDLSGFKDVEQGISEVLRRKGFSVRLISEVPSQDNLQNFSDPNPDDEAYFAAKDMRFLHRDLDVDFLLILEIRRAGFARPYSGLLPQEPPRAVFDLHGELVDLRNNRLLWNASISKYASPDGEWDEPPAFPALTNSFFIALEEAKKQIIETLSGDGAESGSESSKSAGAAL